MEILYDIIMTIFAIIVIIGVFKGFGEDRTITVFEDYNDLGLTFAIPASFVLINYILVNLLGVNATISVIIGSIVSLILLLKVITQTYACNDQDFSKAFIAFFTKLPLAFIWILNIISVLDPGGKNREARRQSRATALVILALLTPIVGGLIVNKTGSLFNPSSWLKGKRIGSGIRNHL